MLARLTLTMGPRTVVADLAEALKWRSEDLLTQTFLNSCYGPPADDTEQVGPPGYVQATRAAQAVEQAGWVTNLYMPALNQSAA